MSSVKNLVVFFFVKENVFLRSVDIFTFAVSVLNFPFGAYLISCSLYTGNIQKKIKPFFLTRQNFEITASFGRLESKNEIKIAFLVFSYFLCFQVENLNKGFI